MQLTTEDYEALEKCYIPRALADSAGLFRVDSLEGRDRVGRKGGGDYSGIVYPWTDPVTSYVVGERLRLDHPPVEFATGKPDHKYLCAPGQRNHAYLPLADPAWLADPTMQIVISEGEKKYLALHRAAFEGAHALNGGSGKPLFMALTFGGVWSWRGVVGAAEDAHGQRVPVRGPIPDLDRIVWKGRKVVLCFDTNAAFKSEIRAARLALARHLESLGAEVYLIDLPPSPEVNGVDDYLAQAGLAPFLDLWKHATRYDWHDELVKSDKGKILPTFSNALTALRLAPAWNGVLSYNEFALRAETRWPPPWNGPIGPWGDHEDSLLIEWMEHQGIRISDAHATRAALTAAREHPYHPVREYLDGLKWDGTNRIDEWLILYLGAEPSDYARAIGKCWLISGVARVYQPGAKADCALILEGGQGKGKSTTLEILGGEFCSDDIAELGSKDASLGAAGVWIVELAELEAMGRAEVSKVKAFLSRRIDRFRPPYGRHYVWVPRQCIFAGSVNLNRYLKDETGGRRFWPVKVGDKLHLDALRRDRDQLWAEAVTRYRAGAHWWLEGDPLLTAAAEEQDDRYQMDPWEPLVEAWAFTQQDVTTALVLTNAIQKPAGQWTRADETRVGMILTRLGWQVHRPHGGRRTYYPPGATP
jgi:predicted P-loop ATPase